MSRPLIIGLVVMILLTGGSVLYLFETASRVQTPESDASESAFEVTEPPLYTPGDLPIEVRIFFPTSSSDLLLRSRDMTIFGSDSPEIRIRQIVERLIEGADDPSLYGTLPAETRLSQVFLSSDGTAYLDFSNALSDNHPGGILPELATVYAITNSLVYNLEEVERVKILIGGVERETLAGHCMLLVPFGLDLSISDIGPANDA